MPRRSSSSLASSGSAYAEPGIHCHLPHSLGVRDRAHVARPGRRLCREVLRRAPRDVARGRRDPCLRRSAGGARPGRRRRGVPPRRRACAGLHGRLLPAGGRRSARLRRDRRDERPERRLCHGRDAAAGAVRGGLSGGASGRGARRRAGGRTRGGRGGGRDPRRRPHDPRCRAEVRARRRRHRSSAGRLGEERRPRRRRGAPDQAARYRARAAGAARASCRARVARGRRGGR